MSGKQDNRRPSDSAPQRIRELMGLFAQRDSISEAIKDICAAEKDDGGNAKAMRQAATRLHKANDDEREQAERDITEYEAAYTNSGTPVAPTRAQAGVRGAQAEVRSTEPQRSPEDGPRGERSGCDGTDAPAAKSSASSPDTEPASSSLGADTAPAAVEPVAPAAGGLSDTDSAPDAATTSERASAGDGSPPPSPATPSLAPTFTAGDRYAREGWQAYQKGRGRDDHGYLSPERVEGFQRGWDLAERQAQRGQG